MTEIDVAAWAHRLDIGMAEVADLLNGSAQLALQLHWGVVDLADTLRFNPDPEVRHFLRSAEAALDFVSGRLEDVWLAARREAR